MNIPIILSLPQIILFIIGLVGLVLFISMITGLIVGERAEREELDEDGRLRPRKYMRRRFKLGRGLLGTLLLVLAALLLWATFLVQSYLGLTGEIKVAHVHATAIANTAHQMSVQVILYDKDSHPTSDNTYLIQGDEWMLQGDIVKFSPLANIIGLHAGYKLTRLEGRFDDINLERNNTHSVIELNGGDDNFFKTTHTQKQWFSWFVDASYGSGVFQAAGTFDVFATQDALIARPTR